MHRLFTFAFLAASFFSINSWASLPDRFLQVSPGIYRSAQPAPENFTELKAMGINTILDVNDDDQELAAETQAAQAVGIRVISRPMSGFWKPKDDIVNANLADLKNPANQPILIHCQHGQDRTGLIVGLHRVEAEGAKPADAYQEMLDRGFHTSLIFLDQYFKDRTRD